MDKEVIDVELHSSYNQFKDFLQSFLWKDMQSEFLSWKSDLQNLLANEDDLKEIYRFQGRIELLDKVLAWPQLVVEAFETTKVIEE